MTSKRKRRLRKLIAVLALVIAIAWVAPFFLSAERFRPLLRSSLEQALRRKVDFGNIALHFFPEPGFTIDNVVVQEAPEFGMEPFARVDRIDCDLRWRSLWDGRLEVGTLQLHDPSINIVRNAAGKWNIEALLLRSQIAQPTDRSVSKPLPELRVEADGARLNFKIKQDKKPFAIMDARADADFNFAHRRMTFRISGDPIRTDLELPTPGRMDLEGTWTPENRNALSVTLRTNGSYLYDWIPLVTGHNPGIYGLLDLRVGFRGTLPQINFAGEAQISNFHHSEELPDSGSIPCGFKFSGTLDRGDQSLKLAAMKISFADSQVLLTGAIAHPAANPDFDLQLELGHSKIQDLLGFGKRILGVQTNWNAQGVVSGQVSLAGTWAERRYKGTIRSREVRVETSSGNFPVSGVSIRIGRDRASLAPARVRLAPGVELSADGVLRDIEPNRKGAEVHPRYSLNLHMRSASLRGLLRFGRKLGFDEGEHIDAEGVGSASLHITGSAWPLGHSSVTGNAGIRSARFLIPGLAQPLNVPHARIQIYDHQIIINPAVAVMGTSVFSGWLMHEGSRARPWRFNIKADHLDLQQEAQWFDAGGHTGVLALFARWTGISSLIDLHRSSSDLFSRLNASGVFSTPLLKYRDVTLRDFRSRIGAHQRAIRVSEARFKTAGGSGSGSLLGNFRQSPAKFSAALRIENAKIEALAPRLPPALATVRGRYSGSAHLQASGASFDDVVRTLQGQATVRLDQINLGSFDPVPFLARRAGIVIPELEPGSRMIPSAVAKLRISDRHVIVTDFPVELSGAKLQLAGSCTFDGSAELRVHADLRGLRPALPEQGAASDGNRLADLQLEGTLHNLTVTPAMRLSQTRP